MSRMNLSEFAATIRRDSSDVRDLLKQQLLPPADGVDSNGDPFRDDECVRAWVDAGCPPVSTDSFTCRFSAVSGINRTTAA